MKEQFNKVRQSIFKRNDGNNFLHFFVAFTIIFFAMTMIILQILTAGVYNSTDKNLRDLGNNRVLFNIINMNQANGATITTPNHGNFGPNNSILLYNSKGQIISPATSGMNTPETAYSDPNLAQIEKQASFDAANIGSIRALTITNSYGSVFHYRYLTMRVDLGSAAEDDTPSQAQSASQVAYMQIFSNVDQIQDGLDRSRQVIITTMLIFWFLSLLASVILSNWTRRPVLEAFERQKTFVENASHELRTPLAILQNRLELLFQNPSATILDESENISESLSEVRNMRMLTTNLLNLARRDSGIKIEPVETDKSFFQAMFESFELLAENADKTFVGKSELEGNIMLDQALIKQLITILYDNALKYSDEDGRVEIKISKSSNHLNISVSDNGEGISDADKLKVFNRFYRVDKARTRQKGGLGLGLSLAKQIVDAYNGKITIEDTLPKGTTFNIALRLTK